MNRSLSQHQKMSSLEPVLVEPTAIVLDVRYTATHLEGTMVQITLAADTVVNRLSTVRITWLYPQGLHLSNTCYHSQLQTCLHPLALMPMKSMHTILESWDRRADCRQVQHYNMASFSLNRSNVVTVVVNVNPVHALAKRIVVDVVSVAHAPRMLKAIRT